MERTRYHRSWGENNKLVFSKNKQEVLEKPFECFISLPCTRMNKIRYTSESYIHTPIGVFHFQAESWNILNVESIYLKYWGGEILCYILSNIIPT